MWKNPKIAPDFVFAVKYICRNTRRVAIRPSAIQILNRLFAFFHAAPFRPTVVLARPVSETKLAAQRGGKPGAHAARASLPERLSYGRETRHRNAQAEPELCLTMTASFVSAAASCRMRRPGALDRPK